MCNITTTIQQVKWARGGGGGIYQETYFSVRFQLISHYRNRQSKCVNHHPGSMNSLLLSWCFHVLGLSLTVQEHHQMLSSFLLNSEQTDSVIIQLRCLLLHFYSFTDTTWFKVNLYSSPAPGFIDSMTSVIDIQVSWGFWACVALGGIVLTTQAVINSLH